jgi:hypothetical protein
MAVLMVLQLLPLLRLVGIVGIPVPQVLDKNLARPLELPVVARLLQYKAEIPVYCNIDSSFSLLKSE